MLALSIGISALLGYLMVDLLWPWRTQSRMQLALQLCLSVAFGIGITSILFFLWITSRGGLRGFIWPEIAAALVLGSIVLVQRRRRIEHRPDAHFAAVGSQFSLRWVVETAFVVVLASACFMFLLFSAREPNGLFDAVGMWNVKARMIFLSGGDWRGAGSPYLGHPDYPLLLPLSIARGWTYVGSDSTVVPAVLAMLFTFGIAGLLVSAVALLRSRTQGMLAGLVLIGLPYFVSFGSWQYADAPLTFFAICTLVLFCLYDYAPPENRSLLVLAGIAAGFAAWTKNEGLLLVLLVLVARAVVSRFWKRKRPWLRELLWVSVGLLPVLLLTAYYKSQVATPNDLIAGQSTTSIVERLSDLSRYELIAKALVQQLLVFGGWDLNPAYLLALYPLVLGVAVSERNKAGVLTAAIVLGLWGVGYLLVYLLTPRDLPWHLMTSLDRLLLQLWPCFVFIYFLTICTPEEALERAA